MCRTLCERLSSLPRDERGGEVLEWALVSGLLIVATFTALGAVARRLLESWEAAW